MSKKDSKEYRDGYNSYPSDIEDNPYPENTNEYELWYDGRSKAQEDEFNSIDYSSYDEIDELLFGDDNDF